MSKRIGAKRIGAKRIGRVVLAALALGACEDGPVFEENCTTPGDEDGNGASDCDDPVCSLEPACALSCGDGTLQTSEACEDGNLVDDDGCDSNCTLTACGNGIKTSTEICDDGNAIDNDGCDNDCTITGCGNGQRTGDEECDDNNLLSGDGCDSNCTLTACGNGIKTSDEICDDGNVIDDDGCDSNCTLTGCGNGQMNNGEKCDDGNLTDNDGCDSNCTLTSCGNGVRSGTETCDDGNLTSLDGCSAQCTAECVVAVTHATLQLAVDDNDCPQIYLPAGTYVEAITIARDVVIVGEGDDASIVDGNGSTRPFTITTGTVTLESLQITNGAAAQGGGLHSLGNTTLRNVQVRNNAATSEGAGIYASGGRLDLEDTLVSQNIVAAPSAQLSTAKGGGLYLDNSDTTIENSLIDSNQAQGTNASGGGLYAVQGSCVLSGGSLISGNSAIATETGNGGGAFVEQSALTMSNTSLTNNRAQGNQALGGGLVLDRSTAAFSVGQVSDNIAEGIAGPGTAWAKGGGIAMLGLAGTDVFLTMDHATASNNQATVAALAGAQAQGGALYLSATSAGGAGRANAAISHSTVSNNSAMTIGTAPVLSTVSAQGGGFKLAANGADVDVVFENSTLSSNTATGSGLGSIGQGGAAVLTRGLGGTATLNLYSSTTTLNSVSGANSDGAAFYLPLGSLFIAHSIVATNTGAEQCSGTLTSVGYNLLGPNLGCAVSGDTTGNLLDSDPLLGPLANNGGSTLTHALDVGSPARDAGNPTGCNSRQGTAWTSDQRDLLRPVGVCDLGAFEAQ